MLWTALQILVGLLVFLGVILSADFLAGRWFFIDRYPDEVHYATTDDGWTIAVARYRPVKPNGAEPVVVTHAVGANRLSLDLTEDLSLARFLAGAGYDTWAIELRGRGQSTRPRLFNARFKRDWSFDEYVEKDVPAALREVLRATGRERVHLVGFSLGGAIAYAVLGGRDAGLLRSAAAFAAPASFAFQQKYLFSWPIRNLRWMRHRLLMRLIAPISGYWRPRLFQNPDNISAATVRLFLVNCSANFGPNEMLQYSDWIANDQFRSIDHRRDYRKDLAKATAPTLFVAGNKDLLAPPPSVKEAYDRCGSAQKKFVIASRGQAHDANYGHFDMLLGNSASKDIYPLVKGWLDEQEGYVKEGEGVRAMSSSSPVEAAPGDAAV